MSQLRPGVAKQINKLFFKKRKKCLVFYVGRAQPPLSVVLLLIFWSFRSKGMNSSRLLWGTPLASCLTTKHRNQEINEGSLRV